MSELVDALQVARDSICAVMKIAQVEHKAEEPQEASVPEIQFSLSFVGTAWCLVESKFLATAHHILNNGENRNPSDRFYVFSVPANGPQAYPFPVTGFPFEDSKTDTAVMEVGSPLDKGQVIPALPVTFSRPIDGAHALTIGFPSPEIVSANVSPAGDYMGGQFFLKSHANDGVVAAQYEFNEAWYFEFNVGWHHGESGGPVIRLGKQPAVFSIMQHYRNVTSPHGVVAGPHRGISLDAIKDTLIEFGAEEM